MASRITCARLTPLLLASSYTTSDKSFDIHTCSTYDFFLVSKQPPCQIATYTCSIAVLHGGRISSIVYRRVTRHFLDYGMPDGGASSKTMRFDSLAAIPVRAAGTTTRKTPIREFLLFPWGDIDTCYGTFRFDKEAAAQLMATYAARTERRDGWLDIDYAHLSQSNNDEPAAHVSAGRFRTETRSDGQWVTELTYTPEAYELVATEAFRYYSPVVGTDGDHKIVELLQLALTNIPAMYNAQPLALSDKRKKDVIMPTTTTRKFSRPAMALVQLEARRNASLKLSDADKAVLEAEKPHMFALFNALFGALMETYPEAHMEEVYEDHVIVGTPPRQGEAFEGYAKIPYSVQPDGMVSLGTPIQVVKKFVAKSPQTSAEADGYEEAGDEGQKMEQLSQRLRTTEQMLFTATGKKSVSAAIGEIERLKTSGGKDLAEKVARLEAQSFAGQRAVLLSDAKKAGKWTAGLEREWDRTVERAKKLGEDPVVALSEAIDSAPVSTHPGRETQPEPDHNGDSGGQLMALSASDRKQLEQDAARYGVDPKVYISRFMENSKTFRR